MDSQRLQQLIEDVSTFKANNKPYPFERLSSELQQIHDHLEALDQQVKTNSIDDDFIHQIKCLKYEVKRLKKRPIPSSSDPANDQDIIHDIKCLKFEVKKLKERSNDTQEQPTNPQGTFNKDVIDQMKKDIGKIKKEQTAQDQLIEQLKNSDHNTRKALHSIKCLKYEVKKLKETKPTNENISVEIPANLKEEFENMKSKIKKHKKDIRCLKYEVKKLRQGASLDEVPDIQERSIQLAPTELPTDIQDTIKEIYDKLADHDNKLDTANQNIDELNRKHDNYVTKPIYESNIEEINNTLKNHEERIQKLEDLNLSETLAKLQDDLNNKASSDEHNKLSRRVSRLSKDFKNKLQQAEIKTQEPIEEEEQEEKEIDQLHKELAELQKSVAKAIGENNEKLATLDDLEKLREDHNKLAEDHDKLTENHAKLTQNYNKLTEDHNKLAEEFANHKADKTFVELISQLDEQVNSLLNDQEQLRKEVDALKLTSSEHSDDISKLKETVAELEKNYAESGQGLQKVVRTLVEDVASLVAQNREDKEALPEQFAELKQEIADKINKLEEDSKDTMTQLNESINREREHHEDTKNALKELRQKDKELDKSGKENTKDVKKIKKRLEHLQDDDSVPKAAQNDIDELRREINKLRKANQSLKCLKYEVKLLKANNSKIEALNQAIKCIKHEVKLLKLKEPETIAPVSTEPQTSSSEVKSLKKQVNKNKDDIKKLKERIDELKDAVPAEVQERAAPIIEPVDSEQLEQINNKILKDLKCIKYEIKLLKSRPVPEVVPSEPVEHAPPSNFDGGFVEKLINDVKCLKFEVKRMKHEPREPSQPIQQQPDDDLAKKVDKLEKKIKKLEKNEPATQPVDESKNDEILNKIEKLEKKVKKLEKAEPVTLREVTTDQPIHDKKLLNDLKCLKYEVKKLKRKISETPLATNEPTNDFSQVFVDLPQMAAVQLVFRAPNMDQTQLE
ncbi:hypothetical protein TRFO_31205 [Tritrichomonas foetus]|uniref:Uncharacterized protein n=1 Tax=Tritrichomonas foetus TaxID=1144522 RepID=A0A1J4JTT5_9EUKA|nr:hypothetical protein TRFO_31205 [Tritrichomonas foetus]|eukprot:OHT01864.1 hypothetical protein TRFO_31205 [Tritrichomonas foetus]